MRQAKLKGWNRGTRPQRLGSNSKCDLTRQGKPFTCTDISLSPQECCSTCKAKLLVDSGHEPLRS